MEKLLAQQVGRREQLCHCVACGLSEAECRQDYSAVAGWLLKFARCPAFFPHRVRAQQTGASPLVASWLWTMPVSASGRAWEAQNVEWHQTVQGAWESSAEALIMLKVCWLSATACYCLLPPASACYCLLQAATAAKVMATAAACLPVLWWCAPIGLGSCGRSSRPMGTKPSLLRRSPSPLSDLYVNR